MLFTRGGGVVAVKSWPQMRARILICATAGGGRSARPWPSRTRAAAAAPGRGAKWFTLVFSVDALQAHLRAGLQRHGARPGWAPLFAAGGQQRVGRSAAARALAGSPARGLVRSRRAADPPSCTRSPTRRALYPSPVGRPTCRCTWRSRLHGASAWATRTWTVTRRRRRLRRTAGRPCVAAQTHRGHRHPVDPRLVGRPLRRRAAVQVRARPPKAGGRRAPWRNSPNDSRLYRPR
jgi:hypothetical protein